MHTITPVGPCSDPNALLHIFYDCSHARNRCARLESEREAQGAEAAEGTRETLATRNRGRARCPAYHVAGAAAFVMLIYQLRASPGADCHVDLPDGLFPYLCLQVGNMEYNFGHDMGLHKFLWSCDWSCMDETPMSNRIRSTEIEQMGGRKNHTPSRKRLKTTPIMIFSVIHTNLYKNVISFLS